MDPIRISNGRLEVLDQTRLPEREAWIEAGEAGLMASAIAKLQIRGAPAIGIGAALALAAEAAREGALEERRARLRAAAATLRASRPTAVNLAWACDRVVAAADRAAVGSATVAAWEESVRREAMAIWEEDRAASRSMAAHGASLFPTERRFLTHCNTGGLATGGGGTALGVILELHRRGDRTLEVWATETRPLLQGARLTAWELRRAGIDAALVTDGAAPFTIARRGIEAVLVGADRIARNGDVANKIGTYSLALAARAAGIPFVVVAPTSTLDPATPDGGSIPVEERDPLEVTAFRGVPTAPEGFRAENPAFDITPAALVTALVTERGVHRSPESAFAGVDSRS
ncbi:MAG TPA: S-methyl-5-thioribose-1-phosphate isomerase [Candidatus Eisenbacteria bacterium]|nr:S-methyl-5-thioribose-1-phosphate isomerase [Candidatus Eisenbacteria bacterium]